MKHFIGKSPAKITITPYQKALYALFSGFNSGAIHPYTALQINGALDEERFCRAAAAVVEQNDALRSFLRLEQDGPALWIYEQAAYTPEIVDIDSEEAVNREISAMLNRPYTAEDDILFRMKLYRLPQSRYIFFFMISHIVSDGESIAAFLKKLLACYADEHYTDTETTHTMVEYNEEEVRFYASDAFRVNCGYWKDRISFAFPEYLVPRFPELAAKTDTPFFMIPTQQIRQCLAKYRCTTNLFLTAVYHLTLCRMLRAPESSFFFMYGNRTRPEYADLIAPQFQIVFSRLRAAQTDTCGELVRNTVGQFMEGVQYAHGCLLSFSLPDAIAAGGLGCIMTYNQMMPETDFAGLKIGNYNVMFNSMEETVLPCSLLMLACNETPEGVLLCPVLAVNDKINKALFLQEFRAVFADTAARLAAYDENDVFFTPQELQTEGE